MKRKRETTARNYSGPEIHYDKIKIMGKNRSTRMNIKGININNVNEIVYRDFVINFQYSINKEIKYQFRKKKIFCRNESSGFQHKCYIKIGIAFQTWSPSNRHLLKLRTVQRIILGITLRVKATYIEIRINKTI